MDDETKLIVAVALIQAAVSGAESMGVMSELVCCGCTVRWR